MTDAAKNDLRRGGARSRPRDLTGKPQAGRFTAGQADLASKAANLMDLTVCPISRRVAQPRR
jgi:hypothetical protein